MKLWKLRVDRAKLITLHYICSIFFRAEFTQHPLRGDTPSQLRACDSRDLWQRCHAALLQNSETQTERKWSIATSKLKKKPGGRASALAQCFAVCWRTVQSQFVIYWKHQTWDWPTAPPMTKAHRIRNKDARLSGQKPKQTKGATRQRGLPQSSRRADMSSARFNGPSRAADSSTHQTCFLATLNGQRGANNPHQRCADRFKQQCKPYIA